MLFVTTYQLAAEIKNEQNPKSSLQLLSGSWLLIISGRDKHELMVIMTMRPLVTFYSSILLHNETVRRQTSFAASNAWKRRVKHAMSTICPPQFDGVLTGPLKYTAGPPPDWSSSLRRLGIS